MCKNEKVQSTTYDPENFTTDTYIGQRSPLGGGKSVVHGAFRDFLAYDQQHLSAKQNADFYIYKNAIKLVILLP